MLIQMTPQQVTDNWPTILHILKPALKRNPRSETDLLMSLGSGMMQAYVVGENAKGLIVTTHGLNKPPRSKLSLWVLFAAGIIPGGPKARRAVMNDIMANDIVPMAKARGCKQILVEASRWGLALQGFKRVPTSTGNMLRKAI